MSTYWLRSELASNSNADMDNGDPVLTINYEGGSVRIYSPDPHEYAVDADLVEKVVELGADIIAYSKTWCMVTLEAKAYGRDKGVDILPFAGLFAFLRRKGIAFNQ